MAEDMIKGIVALGVVFVLLGGFVIGNFENASTEIVTDYEMVETTSEFNDAIVEASSSNFSVSNDVLTLTGNDGIVQTQEVTTSDEHDTLEVTVNQSQGDTAVTVYNGSGTSLTSETVTGDTETTVTVSNYTEASYYLEFDSTSSTDSEVNSYEVDGVDQVSDDVSNLVYLMLVLALIGLALGFWSKFKN